MRFVMVATIFSAISTSVFAQQGTCKLLAVERKLIGAPLSTFMEKCGDDAQKTCEQLASSISSPASRFRLSQVATSRWLDPAETEGIITPFMVLYALHDALVKPMPAGINTPSLAESWTRKRQGLGKVFGVARCGCDTQNLR
jgi:hypothetical protein